MEDPADWSADVSAVLSGGSFGAGLLAATVTGDSRPFLVGCVCALLAALLGHLGGALPWPRHLRNWQARVRRWWT